MLIMEEIHFLFLFQLQHLLLKKPQIVSINNPQVLSINQWRRCRLYYINQVATVAINEAAIGAIIAPRNPPSCIFILCFTVWVAPSVNRPNFSSDSTILILPFVSLFEMNKINPFPAFLLLAKGRAIVVMLFYPNYLTFY